MVGLHSLIFAFVPVQTKNSRVVAGSHFSPSPLIRKAYKRNVKGHSTQSGFSVLTKTQSTCVVSCGVQFAPRLFRSFNWDCKPYTCQKVSDQKWSGWSGWRCQCCTLSLSLFHNNTQEVCSERKVTNFKCRSAQKRKKKEKRAKN